MKMSSTIEEKLASLTKAIEGQTKCAHEQDVKLSKLTNKIDNMIERRSNQSPLKLSKIQHKEVSCLKQNSYLIWRFDSNWLVKELYHRDNRRQIWVFIQIFPYMQSHIHKRLITWKYLRVINLPSFNNLMANNIYISLYRDLQCCRDVWWLSC